VEKLKDELKKLGIEEKRLQKKLSKAKDEGSLQEATTNEQIQVVQEQIEKLSKELTSQLEVQELIAQIEVKNNFTTIAQL